MDKGAGRQHHVVLEVDSALQSLGTGLVTHSTKCHETKEMGSRTPECEGDLTEVKPVCFTEQRR